jgi:quinol monooxygenase YgiN
MSEIHGVSRFTFREWKLEESKRLSAQVMEIVPTKDTGGTVQLEIYFNDDQSECVLYERYRNSEAVIAHATHVGDLMPALFATTGSVSCDLLGKPTAELAASTAGGSGVSIFHPFLSMEKTAWGPT